MFTYLNENPELIPAAMILTIGIGVFFFAVLGLIVRFFLQDNWHD